jgi:ADP-heptose:LPS heptosyltransferase
MTVAEQAAAPGLVRRLGFAPRRVAVLRALALGDLLCAVPALRALRRALPEAEIALIGLPWAEAFAARFGVYLDRFIAFPGWPSLPERPCDLAAVPAFIARMQAERFDLALQLHGSGGTVNPLVALFGARRTAGYVTPGGFAPDPELFALYPEGEHEIRINLGLVERLGAPPCGEELEFPLSPADEAAFAALPEAASLEPGRYVCIHPGARLPSRRWPPARFAAVADALAGDGFEIVLTGTAGEAALTAAVQAAMRAPAVDLTGKTALGSLGALLSGAALLVCNDTGVSHIAAALRLPSVVIASGSDPARWAPLDRERHRVLAHPVACRPCTYDVCPIGHDCALGVTADAVLDAVRGLPLPASPAVPSRHGRGNSDHPIALKPTLSS